MNLDPGSAGGALPTMPAPPALPSLPSRRVTERDCYRTVVDAARISGWRVAHFRPARTKHGWSTPMQGDAGYPDFTLVHPGAGLVWFVEFKSDRGKLTAEQQAWGVDLLKAGAHFRVVYVSELHSFVQDLADAARRPSTLWGEVES